MAKSNTKTTKEVIPHEKSTRSNKTPSSFNYYAKEEQRHDDEVVEEEEVDNYEDGVRYLIP